MVAWCVLSCCQSEKNRTSRRRYPWAHLRTRFFGGTSANTLAPLIVQGTFICGSAILLEAILSFLGLGIPPETPTGNIMAEGQDLFQHFPTVSSIRVFLTVTVLAINMLGDGLRDTIDPRMSKQI